jgi:hypothetical protein
LQQWKADLTTKCHGLTAEAAIEATEILRAHWITARGASRDFDFELQDFFDRAGRAIFSSQEPDAAMHVFWNGRARRGRRAEDHAERDYAMALAVQEQRDAGKSVGAASDAVGKAAVGGVHLTGEAVRKVYNRWRREVRAERALQALDKLWNSNQRG